MNNQERLEKLKGHQTRYGELGTIPNIIKNIGFYPYF
jgi:hypothetical protein